MCSPARRGKTTWRGCGQHIDEVMSVIHLTSAVSSIFHNRWRCYAVYLPTHTDRRGAGLVPWIPRDLYIYAPALGSGQEVVKLSISVWDVTPGRGRGRSRWVCRRMTVVVPIGSGLNSIGSCWSARSCGVALNWPFPRDTHRHRSGRGLCKHCGGRRHVEPTLGPVGRDVCRWSRGVATGQRQEGRGDCEQGGGGRR